MRVKTTPEQITALEPNQVFVFGSNLAGIHGAGAARLAEKRFGAIHGTGCGLMGQSYGIATKGMRIETLPLRTIAHQVGIFLAFAAAHPEFEFLVTKIGCGLAGYTVAEIKTCFDGKTIPPNVALPAEFQP